MKRIFRRRFLDSCSDNLKSKIENPKWVGIFAIALTFVFGGLWPSRWSDSIASSLMIGARVWILEN
jgi:hypothetical protein